MNVCVSNVMFDVSDYYQIKNVLNTTVYLINIITLFSAELHVHCRGGSLCPPVALQDKEWRGTETPPYNARGRYRGFQPRMSEPGFSGFSGFSGFLGVLPISCGLPFYISFLSCKSWF